MRVGSGSKHGLGWDREKKRGQERSLFPCASSWERPGAEKATVLSRFEETQSPRTKPMLAL